MQKMPKFNKKVNKLPHDQVIAMQDLRRRGGVMRPKKGKGSYTRSDKRISVEE